MGELFKSSMPLTTGQSEQSVGSDKVWTDMKVSVCRNKLPVYKSIFGATRPTFLGFVLLCFALVLEAHGTFIHLVCLDAKLATEALRVIWR